MSINIFDQTVSSNITLLLYPVLRSSSAFFISRTHSIWDSLMQITFHSFETNLIKRNIALYILDFCTPRLAVYPFTRNQEVFFGFHF